MEDKNVKFAILITWSESIENVFVRFELGKIYLSGAKY